jgi:transketolase C-terminal domain/subunit
MYAREMSTIKTAGAILLNGIGVRSSAVVSNRTTMPTKRLAASKAFGQTRMNYSLKIAKYRNSASSKAEKIL